MNIYEIQPMNPDERGFLMSSCIGSDLIELYEKIRNKILVYGKIHVWTTRDYISFKHPYGRNEIKLGAVVNIYFKKDHLVLAFNMRNTMPSDPKNILIEAKGHGNCNYYAKIKVGDDLSGLDYLIQQAIYCVSQKHRAVRIDNKFVII